MKLFLLLLVLTLQGCSGYIEGKKVINDCFEPFSVNVNSLFELRPREVVYIRPLHSGSRDTKFFRKHGYKGYVLAEENFGEKDVVNSSSEVFFTGKTIKSRPSFLGYHIGGNREHTHFEVIINKSKYVYFGFYKYQSFLNSLPKRCRFE